MENTDTYTRSELTASDHTRLKIAEMVHRGSASHLGSCYSMVEILLAVYSRVDMDLIRSQDSARDRIIVSKGHSAAAVYAVMNLHGLCCDEFCSGYHQNGSVLSGHVNHFVKYIEHSTGALGHGLSVAAGICIGLRSKGHNRAKVFAVVGDGEMQEGSNWEAIMLAGHLDLESLCILIDYNGIGGVGQTDSCCSLEPLGEKLESFGFTVSQVDGHDEQAIAAAIDTLMSKSGPSAIICRTIKGKGVSFMENNNVWHYRPPDKDAYMKICEEISRGN